LPEDAESKQPEFVCANGELEFKLIRPSLRAKPWMVAEEIENMQLRDRFELLVRKNIWLLGDWVENPVRHGNNNLARADFPLCFSLCDLKVIGSSFGC